MKNVKATVVFPVEVNLKVKETSSLDEIWESVIQTADSELKNNTVPPVIYYSNVRGLAQKDSKKLDKQIESQEEVFQLVLDSLRSMQIHSGALNKTKGFLAAFKTKRNENLQDKVEQLDTAVKNLLNEVVNVMSR